MDFFNKKKDNNKKYVDDICKYCGNQLENKKFYFINRMTIISDSEITFIGLQKLIDELGDFAMSKGYHISASQIILLRPDVLKEFFAFKYKKKEIVTWYLESSPICFKCYEEYIKIVPLK